MKKVVSPAPNLKEVDSADGRRRYRQQPDGTFHVADRDAKALVQYGGFLQPTIGMGGKSEGYRCKCGFGSWFKKCSRCGGECVRET